MSLKATVSLILDDEAKEEISTSLTEEEDVVARFLKRLCDNEVKGIRQRIVCVEDLW